MDRDKIDTAIVAFVDLLGFSERVADIVIPEDLGQIEKSVKSIQTYFTSPGYNELNLIHGRTSLAFSDCIVFAASLGARSVKLMGQFDAILSNLSHLASSQSMCVSKGHFIRGGVDVGMWYSHEDVLISPAMISAYRLEQAACFPIISVSKRLYDILSAHRERSNYHESIDPVPHLFRTIKDEDGSIIYYLDYISVGVEELDWKFNKGLYDAYMSAPPESKQRDEIMEEGYNLSLQNWFRIHGAMIKRALRNADSEKIRKKYLFLADYHNEKAKAYLKEPTEYLISIQ